mgnify:CR=1 FL=1
MRLSEDRISHLAHIITDGPYNDDLVDYVDEDMVIRETKKVIYSYMQMDDEIDSLIIKKLRSYSRNIQEGSREWEILYKKHYEEEMNKRFKR